MFLHVSLPSCAPSRWKPNKNLEPANFQESFRTLVAPNPAREIISTLRNNFTSRETNVPFIPLNVSTPPRYRFSLEASAIGFALRWEYKNMCLSPQSARLRSDLHEKTKTCYRGIPCFPLVLRVLASRRAHTLHAECERGERKSWLSETRRAVLCILQWLRYYVKRLCECSRRAITRECLENAFRQWPDCFLRLEQRRFLCSGPPLILRRLRTTIIAPFKIRFHLRFSLDNLTWPFRSGDYRLLL